MFFAVLLSLIAIATAIRPSGTFNTSATAFPSSHHSTDVVPGSAQHNHSTMGRSSGIPDWANWSVPGHSVTEATPGMPAKTGGPNVSHPHSFGNATSTSVHSSVSAYPHSTKPAFSPATFSVANMTSATTFETRTSSPAPVESVLSEVTSYLSVATSEVNDYTSKAATTGAAMLSAKVKFDISSTNDEANCECSIPPGSGNKCSADCDCCPDKNNNQKVSNICTSFLFWG